jgi:hypothetical protein
LHQHRLVPEKRGLWAFWGKGSDNYDGFLLAIDDDGTFGLKPHMGIAHTDLFQNIYFSTSNALPTKYK